MRLTDKFDYNFIDHVAYIFHTIEDGYSFFSGHNGFRLIYGPGINPAQLENYLFVHVDGIGKIEILAPIENKKISPISSQLDKSGPGLHHICYSVSDISSSISTLKPNGWKIICNPMPDVAFGGRKISFLTHKQFGLVELVESYFDPNSAFLFGMQSQPKSAEVQGRATDIAQPSVPPSSSRTCDVDQVPYEIFEIICKAVDVDKISPDIMSFDEIDQWDSLSAYIFHVSFEYLVDCRLDPLEFTLLEHYVSYYSRLHS